MRSLTRLLFLWFLLLGLASQLCALDAAAIDADGISARFTAGRTGAFSGTVDGILVIVGGIKEDGTQDRALYCGFRAEKESRIQNAEVYEDFLPEELAYGSAV